MTFVRFSTLILAGGGFFWACFLIFGLYEFLHLSANGALFWMLLWTPGFFAWYGYVRRAFGHYLFRRALCTWGFSVIANAWSLSVMYSFQGIPGRNVMATTAEIWIILAIIISLICMIREWGMREPTPMPQTKLCDEEFRRLLDEHRRRGA